MEIAKEIGGFSLCRGRRPPHARSARRIHKLMASLKDKFIEGCDRERHVRLGRPPALGRHGEGAGLLVQQVARRLLRADLLPHRLAARPPPVRVHGGADQLGDEHQGPRAVLRQRLPRARDRGAAARRERVADRLRRRRRQDPLRAERRQGRRRARLPHDHPRARGGRAVRVDLGLHRARRPVGRRTSARSSRSSSAARCPGSRMGMLQVLEQALAYGQKQQADRLAGQGSIFDGRVRLGRDGAASGTIRRFRPRSSRSPTCCGSRRRRSASTSPSIRSRRCAAELRAKTDATIAELERRRDGEIVVVGGIVSEVKQLTTKRGEQMVFLRLDDVTGGDRLRRLRRRLRRRARALRRPTGS